MNIVIRNCNNVINGTVSVTEGRLNIKYAINGTGKSTLARAIEYGATENSDGLRSLTPYQYAGDATPEHIPAIDGFTPGMKVAVFDERYVDQYVFLEDELVKNSFDIFVKTQNYERQLTEINRLIQNIRTIFEDNPDLESLISDMDEFIKAFGNARTGIARNSSMAKGLKKGNVIEHIPEGLEDYSAFLTNEQNVKWLKWQADGCKYMNLGNKCPFCAGPLEPQRELIERVHTEYDSKTVEHLSKILALFERLGNYFTDETRESVMEITSSVHGLSDEQSQYLSHLKEEIVLFQDKLLKLKSLDFYTLKNVDRLSDEINGYMIDLHYLPHLDADLTQSKVGIINGSIEELRNVVGNLQGLINRQKREIANTVQRYSGEINTFLQNAGYAYTVYIEEGDDNSYKLKLRYGTDGANITEVKSHLSYGERNAFALVMFMYNTIHDQAEFIVLDDPISSFDKNKKFAIIDMLFIRNNSFRGKTSLLLTHDFEPVIDAIYNHAGYFQGLPVANFLENINGQLLEKPIVKENICSSVVVAQNSICEASNLISKVIYLRRFVEITSGKNTTWDLLSNILHKRNPPTLGDGITPMESTDVIEATGFICRYIEDFDYVHAIDIVTNRNLMINYYHTARSNYEKLQLYRIILGATQEEPIVRKFINQTYHIENDYLFQLNPNAYNTIPIYIVQECDKAINELEQGE